MRALKLAVPATCIIIALFGAPLAMTSYRAGTAMGIGISLATTITFLLLVQLSQALGGSGLIKPRARRLAPQRGLRRGRDRPPAPGKDVSGAASVLTSSRPQNPNRHFAPSCMVQRDCVWP